MIIWCLTGKDFVLHFFSLDYFYETIEIELNEEKLNFLKDSQMKKLHDCWKMKTEKQWKVDFLSWMKYFPEKNDSSKKIISLFAIIGKNLIILTWSEKITIKVHNCRKRWILRKGTFWKTVLLIHLTKKFLDWILYI